MAKEDASGQSLFDIVNSKRNLDSEHHDDYRRVAHQVENFTDKIQEYKDNLEAALGKDIKDVHELYVALIRHVANDILGMSVGDPSSIDESTMSDIRQALRMHYGFSSENDLRNELGELKEGESYDKQLLDQKYQEFAGRRAQTELQQAVQPLVDQRDFVVKGQRGETHHEFLEGIAQEAFGEKYQVQDLKTPQEAQQLMGQSAAQYGAEKAKYKQKL